MLVCPGSGRFFNLLVIRNVALLLNKGNIMVTVAQINELRKATQVSMLLCKQALEATGGDFDAAKEWLRARAARSPVALPSSASPFSSMAPSINMVSPMYSPIPTGIPRWTSAVTAARPLPLSWRILGIS